VIASRSWRIRFVLASTARIPSTLKPAKSTRKPIVTPTASRGQSVSRRQRTSRFERSLRFTDTVSRQMLEAATAEAASARCREESCADGR